LAGYALGGLALIVAGVASSTSWIMAGGAALLVATVGAAVLAGVHRVGLERVRRGIGQERTTRVPVQSVSKVNPLEVGIDPTAEKLSGGGNLYPYLGRKVDKELLDAMHKGLAGEGPWIVVVTGSSKVGKSRTLFEALRRCVGYRDVDLVAPVNGGALQQLAAERRVLTETGRPAVLWLDDLEPFLSQGMTLQTLRDWHRSVGEGLVVATYRGGGSDLRASGPGALATIAAEVLAHAREIQMQPTDAPELTPARKQLPTNAIGAIEEHGLGAYLVAVPALVQKLETARHSSIDPDCPEGAAVIYAAIDWARCGRCDPIPQETLHELWPNYLRAELRATEAGFEAGLAWALRPVVGTIALLEHQQYGYRPHSYAVQFVADERASAPPQEAAWVGAINGAIGAQALNVGISASLHGSHRNALTAFQWATESPSTEITAIAKFNLGVTLSQLNRPADAIAVYDEVIEEHGGNTALLEQVARAMVNKGFALVKLERHREAIAVYEEVLRRFGDASEIGLREQAAAALVNQGIALTEVGDLERAIATFDLVQQRFGEAPEEGLREQVATALINKGMTLNETDRPDAAIAVYDEVSDRYANAPEAALQRLVAEALSNSGAALAALGRQEDAIATYGQVVDRYAEAPDQGLSRLAGPAMYSIALTLATLGREQEAIAVFDDVTSRYIDSFDSELRELAERALTGKSLALGTLKRSEGIREGDAEVLERANVSEAQRLEADFERNLSEPVHMMGIHLDGLDVFADLDWQFHPSMNVLLGRNGYGKSLLLRFIAGMLQRDGGVAEDLFKRPDGRIELELIRGGELEKIERSQTVFSRASLGKVPLLAIPDARFMDRSTTTVADPEALSLTRDGALHFLSQQPYQSTVERLLGGLAIDYWEHGKSFDVPTFSLINDVLDRLQDRSFEFSRIERVGRSGSRIMVRTDGVGRELEIQRASQGTLSVITMFGLIHWFLQEIADARGDGAGEAVNQRAIVLIDEVDAHLHPVWQQKIRNALVDVFPNVQFLLTAHSPLVVAGCGPGEVSVLRNQAGSGYVVEQIPKDFVGASAQDLYTEIFELEDFDETFLRYATQKLTGEDGKGGQQLGELLEKQHGEGLTSDEDLLLNRLVRDGRRMARVSEVRRQRQNDEVTETEDKAEILRLKDKLAQARGDK
jgi:tetratricopeptide (TPR) repeat protein/energy-coupling factor transporter ATP-binding protein EcfA2